MKLLQLLRKRTVDARGEDGFTLVEILASLVVLSIAGLAMTAYFMNAMSYAKGNQNKTVMVNLARNTLFYMQKESNFGAIQSYFKANQGSLPEGVERETIDSDGCPATSATCADYQGLVSDPTTLKTVLNPVINDVAYRVDISYQADLYGRIGTESATLNGADSIKGYLLPIKVVVSEIAEDGEDLNSREWTEVEGYITNETIR
ncbi:prepilin-type N-terminal cleavage/methylation domain-containing protein [Paenibacillus methanolicus]|uniref:Prepilin-type N-terminal cleavage/methylation domain-containing protein n=2 Tax=Paenibacillus methanolicus TaxID=582686 RepID=A0A5S5BWU1_9BACL|nr:prepilin-type N-terminal cleavage/methylation domain-containing protein [Paenibacillus methanolicus]